jgi:SHS2 domain-containing protein
MTDDLETLRKAVEAFGRRKNELTEDGKQALYRITFNIKIYAQARENIVETRDERPVELMRKLIVEDIAIIEAELRTKGEG